MKHREKHMNDRCVLRQEAYLYIVKKLASFPVKDRERYSQLCVELDELRCLKEGIADPSEALVAFLKELLAGSIEDLDIEEHLIKPFAISNGE